MNWNNALSYCQNYRAGMYLPNREQLELIYNYKSTFDLPITYYWSSTSLDSNQAYELDFSNGTQSDGTKNGLSYVMCLGEP